MLSCLSACRKHNVSCPIVECKLYIPSEQHLNCIQEFIDSKAGQINNRAQTNAGVEKKGDLDALCSLQEVGDVRTNKTSRANCSKKVGKETKRIKT
jgi:hypothetical protein